MKVMLVFVLACVAFVDEARAQSSCAETIPKESQLVPAGEERIEGGTRCFVKPKDGGERSLHTVIWDPPIIEDKEPKKKDPKPQPAAPVAGGCDATESLLLEMWQHIADARKNTTSKKPSGQQTYAIAYVFDEKCQFVAKAHGEFTADGVHAEGNILTQIKVDQPLGKQIKKGYWMFWVVDQYPCDHPAANKPAAGYCTKRLKQLPQQRKLGQRVFVVVDVKAPKKGSTVPTYGSPKVFAESGKTPKRENFFELTNLQFKPPT